MTSRLRLLGAALLVGGAVLVMHVEVALAATPSPTAHADHRDCPEGHCGDAEHGSHVMSLCSMLLVALGGALLAVRRSAAHLRSAVDRAIATARSVGPPPEAPRRPPDLAALAVMRC